METFVDEIRKEQIDWRKRRLTDQRPGYHNGKPYDHVLPRTVWELNLWKGIRSNTEKSLPKYIDEFGVKPHTGIHNLCSSWVLCANLYFPFRSQSGRELVASFMSHVLGVNVRSCDSIELEYEHPEPHLKPAPLLGEEQGGRGTGQTSPDVAFEITTDLGRGVVLVESKFTEHWFYECSGHKNKTSGREPNPDRDRCNRFVDIINQPDKLCHLNSWGRKYWHYLNDKVSRNIAEQIKVCPAATGAYQLFRQQALAEALSKEDHFEFAYSAVAYDSRNEKLFQVIRKTDGKSDLRKEWSSLFQNQINFVTFSHQTWVNWVRDHNLNNCWNDWLEYVSERYGY